MKYFFAIVQLLNYLFLQDQWIDYIAHVLCLSLLPTLSFSLLCHMPPPTSLPTTCDHSRSFPCSPFCAAPAPASHYVLPLSVSLSLAHLVLVRPSVPPLPQLPIAHPRSHLHPHLPFFFATVG